MLKIVSKFAMDILPSVVATIIGAYIVNHYIVTRPGADAAPVAAAVSSADPKKAETVTKAETSSAVRNIPQPGVTAKGISERAMIEQTAAEKPTVVEKSAEKPAETGSVPAETRRQQPGPREKVIAKSVTPPVAPAAVAAAPVVAAPNTAPAVEPATVPEEHRDANELARAAIERLRGGGDGSPRAPEAARVPDAPRAASPPPAAATVASAPAVRPLPPPIMVSTSAADNPVTGSSQTKLAYPASDGADDARRPIPPADIPLASPSLPSPGPLDLRAEAVEPERRQHGNVAEDMLLAAKSVFQAVLPK